MNDGSADGLSGILHQLANGEDAAKSSASQDSSAQPAQPKIHNDDNAPHMQSVHDHDDEELIVAEVEEDDTQPTTPRPRPAVRRPAARKKNHGLKTVAVPVLAVVGFLCLIPAIWGTMILGGAEVAGSQKDGAKAMAMMMLACWPIAIALLGGAVFYHFELRRQKQLAAAAEAAGRTRR